MARRNCRLSTRVGGRGFSSFSGSGRGQVNRVSDVPRRHRRRRKGRRVVFFGCFCFCRRRGTERHQKARQRRRERKQTRTGWDLTHQVAGLSCDWIVSNFQAASRKSSRLFLSADTQENRQTLRVRQKGSFRHRSRSDTSTRFP